MNSSKLASSLLKSFGICLVVAATGCTHTDSTTQKVTPVNILFLGDTSHAESYHVQYEADGKGNIIKEKGYDYSLAKMKPILTDADYVVVNIETPLTELRDPPFPDKGYNHWTDPAPAAAAYLRHNFDAVSLANNHTLDFGIEGLKETLDTLKDSGITYFGAGLNKAEADAPLRKSFELGQCKVNLVVFGRFEYRESYDEKYDFYAEENKGGASALDIDSLVNDIKKIKAETPKHFVVIYPHWGKNYKWREEIQERYAKTLVDAGADLILGHGAHTMGEVMTIDNTLAVYSLGNFVFNTWGRFPKYPEVLPMSLVSQLSLSPAADSGVSASLKLYPIYSNNREIHYQPRFVTDEEFDRAYTTLIEKGTGGTVLTRSKDQYGHFMETPIKNLKCSPRT